MLNVRLQGLAFDSPFPPSPACSLSTYNIVASDCLASLFSSAAFKSSRSSYFETLIDTLVSGKASLLANMGTDPFDFDGHPVTLEAKGRHDPCVVPRAVPIVESMAALALADMALIQKSRM